MKKILKNTLVVAGLVTSTTAFAAEFKEALGGCPLPAEVAEAQKSDAGLLGDGKTRTGQFEMNSAGINSSGPWFVRSSDKDAQKLESVTLERQHNTATILCLYNDGIELLARVNHSSK